MFKVSYNRLVLRFELHTVTPLAIRAGETGLDPSAVDLACVRTHHVQHGSTVYIPGSSLKGVLRSAAEASLRTQRFEHLGGRRTDGACDPTKHRESCARHQPKGKAALWDTAKVHRDNCLACRLFGSLSMRGRCAIRDLFPFPETPALDDPSRENFERANRLELRHGIMINRVSGAVDGKALFEQEVVPPGVRFHGEIAMQNYQAWQLGLLLSALEELDLGFAQLGSSKSRGLGVVKVSLRSLVHEQRAGTESSPRGVGDLVDDATRRDYGLFPEQPLPAATGMPRGLSRRFEVDASGVGQWRETGQGALDRLQASAQGGT